MSFLDPYTCAGRVTPKASSGFTNWPVILFNTRSGETKKVLMDANGDYTSNLANWTIDYANGDIIDIIVCGEERGFVSHTIDTDTQGSTILNITTKLETAPSGEAY